MSMHGKLLAEVERDSVSTRRSGNVDRRIKIVVKLTLGSERRGRHVGNHRVLRGDACGWWICGACHSDIIAISPRRSGI